MDITIYDVANNPLFYLKENTTKLMIELLAVANEYGEVDINEDFIAEYNAYYMDKIDDERIKALEARDLIVRLRGSTSFFINPKYIWDKDKTRDKALKLSHAYFVVQRKQNKMDMLSIGILDNENKSVVSNDLQHLSIEANKNMRGANKVKGLFM